MPTSLSRLSFTDCFDLFDSALNDDVGIRVAFAKHGDAMHFRTRCNAARALDRRENAQSYDHGHVLFGRSIYDNISIRLVSEDEETFLYFERRDKMMKIVPLSELREAEYEEAKPPAPKLAEQGVTAVQERKIERRA